jgi:hypothetical protein
MTNLLAFRSEKGIYIAGTTTAAKKILQQRSEDDEAFPLEVVFVSGDQESLRADIPIPVMAADYLTDLEALSGLTSGLLD